MRVSDDRYNRDRLRFDLAVRMIRHEARTCTIRAWTGLSDDRIRKLYRSYLLHHSPQAVRRHRGKSPRQVDYFLRSRELHFEGTTLASLFCMFGLFPPAPGTRPDVTMPMSVERAELFCQAYETYLALHEGALVSFEHGWFLLVTLMKHEELELAPCASCGRLFLRALIRAHDPLCGSCASESAALRRRRNRARGSAMEEHHEWSPEPEPAPEE